jgi:hypothetical protein
MRRYLKFFAALCCACVSILCNARDLTHLIPQLSMYSTPDKIALFSNVLVGKPYQTEPLGEGDLGEYSQAPLFRFDRFDCETFVDIVLALSYAKQDSDFLPTINHIRYYNGEVSFATRNHFTDVDWIPNNIAAGFIYNITDKVAGTLLPLQTQTVYINKQEWYAHLPLSRIKINGLTVGQKQFLLEKLRMQGQYLQNKSVSTRYLLARDILAHENDIFKRIPQGAIIFIIRPNYPFLQRIDTELSIAHMGFAIRDKQQLYFRHASSMYKKVVNVPFQQYLQFISKQDKANGILIYAVRS